MPNTEGENAWINLAAVMPERSVRIHHPGGPVHERDGPVRALPARGEEQPEMVLPAPESDRVAQRQAHDGDE
jgi:hypothetical protein